MKEMKDIGDLFKERLEGFEVNDIQNDWNDTEIKLHKMRFYKFSPTNFNIYYCSFLLLAFALSVSVFVKTCFFENDIKSVNNITVIDKETSGNEKEILLEEKNNKVSDINNRGLNIVKNNQSTKGEEASPKFNKRKPKAVSGGNHSNVSNGSISLEKMGSGNKAASGNEVSGNHTSSANEQGGSKTSSPQEEQRKDISSPNELSDTHSPAHGLTNTVNDNLNIIPPKKNIVYITRQDTIEVYDTLRRKKPFKKNIKK